MDSERYEEQILGGVKGRSAPYRPYIGVEASEMKYKT